MTMGMAGRTSGIGIIGAKSVGARSVSRVEEWIAWAV
jgi:hypothetical protein